MAQDKKITLYALDCGSVNWRLYRMEYHYDGERARHVTSPLSSPLAHFTDQKLPAVLTLTPDGTALEAIGETALASLEDSESRHRVREFFKPSIGSHLITDPSPHQKRYSHFEALLFTRLLLKTLINQIREEKYNGEHFDEQVHFSIAYPDRWQAGHEGKIFEDFYHVILECFTPEVAERVHFVPESEGVMLGLRDQSLLERMDLEKTNLIIDVGGSTTTFYARRYSSSTGTLSEIDRYYEPFGGGLYDAQIARKLAAELKIPSPVLSAEPAAFMTLRVWSQLIKEAICQQILGLEVESDLPAGAQTLTLAMNNGQVFRRNFNLTPEDFFVLADPLDKAFQDVLTRALNAMSLNTEDVGRVILLGDGSLMPGIIDVCQQRMGEEIVFHPENPGEMIVRGIGLSFTASLPEREEELKKILPEKKSGWRLIHEDGSVVEINKEIMIAGRSPQSDLVLDSKSCSRTHALIRLEGNTLTLIDLRSRNGTFVNQSRLSPNKAQNLRLGDQILFGDQFYSLE